MQPAATRAIQRLIVDGFTLYSAQAAICTRLVATSLLDNPEHAWAVLFGPQSMQWTTMLPDEDQLKELFANAAVRSSIPSTPQVVCHTQGGLLLLPLVPADVRNARMRIEAAVALGKAPPAERLEAFPDELIEREAKRRRKTATQSPAKPEQE